jgi:hypothetical protein
MGQASPIPPKPQQPFRMQREVGGQEEVQHGLAE